DIFSIGAGKTERHLPRIGGTAVREFPQPLKLSRGESNVNPLCLTVVPEARPAIDAFLFLKLVIDVPQHAAVPQIAQRAVAVQRHHRIAEVSEHQRTFVFLAVEWFPGGGGKGSEDRPRQKLGICSGRDVLMLGSVGKRCPGGGGLFEELAKTAVN